MKNKFTNFLLLLAMAGYAATVNAATITVNPGGSIQTAVNQANSGDIVQVNAGTYTQKVLFSGAADDGVILRANGTVILDGSSLSPSGREGLITISNSDNVSVEGFILRNFRTTSFSTPVGILVDSGSDNVQLINNTIYNIENNRTNCNQNNDCYVGAHGIGVFGNTTNAITNLLIQGNEVYNCDLMSSEAFVLNGNIDGFEIYDNVVRDNDNIGFDFIGYEPYDCSACTPEQTRVKNGLVAGNQAYRNSSGNNPHYTGDESAGGFYVDGGRNIIFAGNISYENDFGFEFASEWNNRKTENILMVNNVVYNNTVTGLVMGGYSSSTGNTGNGGGGGSAENIYVYNNTFYNNQAGTSYYATEVTFQYRVKNSRFYNNIFYTKGNTSDIYNTWCGTCGNSNTGNSWSRNVWFGDAGTSGAVPGTNNTKSNPQFTTTGSNYTLKSNSPAINAGSTQSNLTNWTASYWDGFFYTNGDIPAHGTLVGSTVVDGAGNNRFQGTIDAGAYEFGSTSSTIFPDPAKVYYVDALNGRRLSANGSSEDASSVSQNTTGANVEWQFVAKGNGYWHLRRAAGGSKPGIRTDNTAFADMQATSSNGIYTYYDLIEKTAGSGEYHLSLPDGPTNYRRLQLHPNDGTVRMTSDNFTGTWVTFTFTEVGSSSRVDSSEETSTEGELEQLSTFSLYPNPTSSIINLSGVEKGQNIQLFDLLGALILETTDTQINVAGLKSGTYLLQVEGQAAIKFIKE